ncbi:MAG: hypothetical protein ACYTHJ_04705 [Planctomycetota bacterium]|jgi:hypothetical protein
MATADHMDVATPARSIGSVRWKFFRIGLTGLLVIVFILVTGDLRRRTVPLGQAEVYASMLSERQGETSSIPLNVSLDVPQEARVGLYNFDHLTREQARMLRGSSGPVLLAYTREITRIILSDGRAVVLFDNGEITSRWLGTEEFRDLLASRNELIAAAGG